MAWKDIEPKKFSCIRELNGISARTMEEHYEIYKGYVPKVNEIQKKLDAVDRGTANQIFSDLRALRVDLSFAVGGVKNHEIYFGHLGGNGGKPTGRLLEQIERDFPSYDAWLADFKASGTRGARLGVAGVRPRLEDADHGRGRRAEHVPARGTPRRSWRWTSTSTRT